MDFVLSSWQIDLLVGYIFGMILLGLYGMYRFLAFDSLSFLTRRRSAIPEVVILTDVEDL